MKQIIIVDINGVQNEFVDSKKVDKFIAQKVKEHLAHPFFFNLEAIAKYSEMSDKLMMTDSPQFIRACNKHYKLLNERRTYLSENNIAEPIPLTVTIIHK